MPLYLDYASSQLSEYCGSRTIGVAESYELSHDFLTLSPETRQLRIETNNHNDVGTYSIPIVDYVGTVSIDEFEVSITITGCKLTDFTINSYHSSLGLLTWSKFREIDYNPGYRPYFELNPPECGQTRNFQLSAQWVDTRDEEIVRDYLPEFMSFEDPILSYQLNDTEVGAAGWPDSWFIIRITAVSPAE